MKVIGSNLSLEAGLLPAVVDQISCDFVRVLETSKVWDSTASPGNLFQCCTTLLVKMSFVMSNLNLWFVAITAFYIIYHLWEEFGFLTCFWRIKILTKVNIYSVQHSPLISMAVISTQTAVRFVKEDLPFLSIRDWKWFPRGHAPWSFQGLRSVSLSTVPPPRSSLPCLKMDVTFDDF